MSLRISSDVSLPLEAARWTFADLAIKGAGKTYAASVLAEEMVRNGIPIVAIDCMGVWWGLRVGVDGHSGLPVVVFGGKHKDLEIPTMIDKKSHFPKLNEAKLQLMAKSILKAGISAVIDTSEFSKALQRRVAAVFISEVYRLNQDYGTRHIFLEEADTLAPQRLSGELNFTFGAVDDLVRRGGNFNLGCTLITQRSAVLNKDVLTQCNCLLVLRILAKLDKDAVKSWVQEMSAADERDLSKWYDTLKDLKNGEGWIWHPESDLFKRIKFRKRETLHATREYFRQENWERANVAKLDVTDFISKFKKVFEPTQEFSPSPAIERKVPEFSDRAKAVVQVKTEPKSTEELIKNRLQEAERQASNNFLNALHDEVEEKPVPIEVVNLEEKKLVVNISHSEKAISISTDGDQEAQIIYVLAVDADKQPRRMTEILNMALEHGWIIPSGSWGKLSERMLEKGLLIHDGPTYRLPACVTYESHP